MIEQNKNIETFMLTLKQNQLLNFLIVRIEKYGVSPSYEEICEEKLEMLEDLGGFGKVEQEILTDVCQENKVPQVLVSKLLHAEFSSQGMGKHSKVFKSLNKILSEEWRDDLTEIVGDMKKERAEKKMYR